MHEHKTTSPTKRARSAGDTIQIVNLKRRKMDKDNEAAITDNIDSNTVSPQFPGNGCAKVKRSLTLVTLPGEILIAMLECLAPDPITPGIGISLWNTTTPEWAAYFDRRRNLFTLRLVNRRFNALAKPLLFRNVVVGSPRSLCFLLCQLMEDPSLGLLIRHLSVPLHTPAMAENCHEAWDDIKSYYRLGSPDPHPNTGRDDTIRRVRSWFEQNPPRQHDPMVPYLIVCTVLCFASSLEVLNLGLREPTKNYPWSTLWAWFLDEGSSWMVASHIIPKEVTTSYPRLEELGQNPCWPPPFFRRLVVEYGSEPKTGGNFIACQTLPLAELAMHHWILKHLRDVKVAATLRGLFSKRNPKTIIANLSPEDRLVLNRYLDSIKQLEPIKALNVASYLDDLKTATRTYAPTAHPTPDPVDHIAPLVNTALTILEPGQAWPSRLTIASKSITAHLASFLFQDLPPERTIHAANLTTLTLYAHLHDNQTPTEPEQPYHQALRQRPKWQQRMHEHDQGGWRQRGADRRDLLKARLLDVLKLTNPGPDPDHSDHNPSQTTPASNNNPGAPAPAAGIAGRGLKALHLPLRLDPFLTDILYHPRGHLTFLSLPSFSTITTITLTMEALLGHRKSAWSLFCEPFVKPELIQRPTQHMQLEASSGQPWDSISALLLQEQARVDALARQEAVRREGVIRGLLEGALPKSVERLRLVEWWGEYAERHGETVKSETEAEAEAEAETTAEGEGHVLDRKGPVWWYHQQHLVVVVVGSLGRFLRAVRPGLREVEVLLHRVGDEEAEKNRAERMRIDLLGWRGIRRWYEALGIELTVRDFEENEVV
jgi:hypothetical protein